MCGRAVAGQIDLGLRVVRRDLPREDRQDREEEEKEGADHRLPVAENRIEKVGADGRARLRLGGLEAGRPLDGRRDGRDAHRTSLARGSSTAVAASATRIAKSTATTMSRKSACISA